MKKKQYSQPVIEYVYLIARNVLMGVSNVVNNNGQSFDPD